MITYILIGIAFVVIIKLHLKIQDLENTLWTVKDRQSQLDTLAQLTSRPEAAKVADSPSWKWEDVTTSEPKAPPAAMPEHAAVPEPSVKPEPTVIAAGSFIFARPEEQTTSWPEETSRSTRSEAHARKQFSLEHQFGARLPVWIGGIALALSGMFLVKYSFEQGWLQPLTRVIMATLFGIMLTASGEWYRRRENIPNPRIPQSLTGAGIAVLYGSAFAATSVYHFLSPLVGFTAMTAVTALTILLSLVQGPPIAVLAMLGGFTTPLLVGSTSPSGPALFSYLAVVYAGLLFTFHRRGWGFLIFPAFFGVLSWTLFWVFIHYTGHDLFWMWGFLVVVSAATLRATQSMFEETDADNRLRPLWRSMPYALSTVPSAVMGLIMVTHGYGTQELGLFALLGAGGMVLAWRDERRYGLLPWISLGALIVALLGWNTQEYSLQGMAFAATGAAHGLFAMWRFQTARKRTWAHLACASALSSAIATYVCLNRVLFSTNVIWTCLGLGLAALFGVIFTWAWRSAKDEDRDTISAFLTTAAAFAAMGLIPTFSNRPLFLAWCLESLALAGIRRLLPISTAPRTAAVLGALGGVPLALLAVYQILTMESLKSSIDFWFLMEANTRLGNWLFDAYSLWYILAAALVLGIAGRLSHDVKAFFPSRFFAILNILLSIGSVYAMIAHLPAGPWEINASHVTIMTRGLLNNALLALALGWTFVARWLRDPAHAFAPLLITGCVLFKIVALDLIIYNPLWTATPVSGWTGFNSLLLPFGLPIVWMALLSRRVELPPQWSKIRNGVMLLFVFVLITLNVRFFFQGPYLHGFMTSDAEIYSYSVAWLLFGIGLLTAGIKLGSQPIRFASLAIMVITVAKVFLYDTSALEGLLRVGSFFGLGLSLIGLSYFYSKFVFNEKTTS